MALPLWGDGSLWGDGDKWSRLFGSTPFIQSVEHMPQRVAVEIAHSGSDFYIDRISLTVRLAPQKEERFDAQFGASVGEHVAIEVGYSAGGDFQINNLRVIGQVLNKRNPG